MSKKTNLKTISLFAVLFAILISLLSFSEKPITVNYESVPVEEQINTQQIKDSLLCLIHQEADSFVKKIHPNCPDTVPQHIVKIGLENDIDICFMLAQTQFETAFGKTGIGRETSRYSLFGVERRWYNSYPEAIDDYVRILKKFYLSDSISEKDLMTNYVNKSGHRYASNPEYEPILSKYYNKIKEGTNLDILQQQIRLMN